MEKQRYFGLFKDWDSMNSQCSYGDKLPPDEQIVYAMYESPDYEGWATIVYRDADGQLWENNDSHCSCYGLESWNPEQTTKEALMLRNKDGYQGLPGIAEALA